MHLRLRSHRVSLRSSHNSKRRRRAARNVGFSSHAPRFIHGGPYPLARHVEKLVSDFLIFAQPGEPARIRARTRRIPRRSAYDFRERCGSATPASRAHRFLRTNVSDRPCRSQSDTAHKGNLSAPLFVPIALGYSLARFALCITVSALMKPRSFSFSDCSGAASPMW